MCVCVQEVTKESFSYPMSVLRGLVTEGANVLLMRLIVLRKKMPEHMTFISFDQGLQIIQTTFVSHCDSENSCSFCVLLVNSDYVFLCGQRELGLMQLEVGDETVEVFGVERTVHSVEDSPSTWQCYFLADG